MPVLEVHGLVKIYGRRRVVDGVDFEVQGGEIVGLLGPNGAGKTTSFRMACGMIEPYAGQVLLNELDVTHWPMYRRARDGGMGYLAQESSVFRKLTVEKNLLGMLEMLGVDRAARKRRCDELLDQFDITRLRKSLAMSLSGGSLRRCEPFCWNEYAVPLLENCREKRDFPACLKSAIFKQCRFPRATTLFEPAPRAHCVRSAKIRVV